MGRPRIRKTVENYCSTSIKRLKEFGYLDCASGSGILSWNYPSGERMASVNIQVSKQGRYGTIRFQYVATNRLSEVQQEMDYQVQLVTTPCNFGGRRWWFICPLVTNGRPCGRRVGVLYLGPRYFGCRKCYKLNYQSSKDSHKYDGMFRRMGLDPKIAKKIFKRERL